MAYCFVDSVLRANFVFADRDFTIREAESNDMPHLHKGDNAAAHPVSHRAQPDSEVVSNLFLAVPSPFIRYFAHICLAVITTLSPGEELLVAVGR